MALNFGAGYDTLGLAEFANKLDYSSKATLDASASANAKLLKDGFYFDDHNDNVAAGDGNADDAPELKFFARFRVGPGLGADLGVLRATVSVNGRFTGTVNFDLNDLPNPTGTDDAGNKTYPTDSNAYTYDGKVRLDELQQIVNYNPTWLFNINGNLVAGADIQFKLEVGLPPVLIPLVDYTVVLVEREVYSFSLSSPDDHALLTQPAPQRTMQLADLDTTTGALTLNVGTRANLRGVETDKADEDYTVVATKDNGDGSYDVTVTAFGLYEQTYLGVRSIAGNAGGGQRQAARARLRRADPAPRRGWQRPPLRPRQGRGLARRRRGQRHPRRRRRGRHPDRRRRRRLPRRRRGATTPCLAATAGTYSSAATATTTLTATACRPAPTPSPNPNSPTTEPSSAPTTSAAGPATTCSSAASRTTTWPARGATTPSTAAPATTPSSGRSATARTP